MSPGPCTDGRDLVDYAITAGTTAVNAQRLLRALKLRRPVLLEGSPGVGKTSLVAALAKASGNHLVRINLSEQTVKICFSPVLKVSRLEGLEGCEVNGGLFGRTLPTFLGQISPWRVEKGASLHGVTAPSWLL